MLFTFDTEQGDPASAPSLPERRMLIMWTDFVPKGGDEVTVNLSITTLSMEILIGDVIRSYIQVQTMVPGRINFGLEPFPPHEVETVRQNGALAVRADLPEIFPAMPRAMIYAAVPGARADFPEWGNADACAQLNHQLTQL